MSDVYEFEIKDGKLIKYHGNAKNVVIPNEVVEIEEYAFRKNPDMISNMTSIFIPKSVKKIGTRYTFGGGSLSACPELESIVVDKDNPIYHSQDNCLIETATKTLISGCNYSIIPNDGSVTKIGIGAFEYCRKMTSIVIPDCVTSIGAHAFQYCSSLRSVVLPTALKSLQKETFFGCQALENISIPNSVTKIGRACFYDTGLRSIVIPEGVISIGKGAFAFCFDLKYVFIPTSVKKIEFSFAKDVVIDTVKGSFAEAHFRALRVDKT